MKAAIKILPLATEDLEAVMEISKNTPEFNIGSEAPQFYGLKSLATWVDDPKSVSFVAKDGDKVVGFLLGQVILGRDGMINMSVVDKTYRGQGIATQLQKLAETKFAEKGCNRIWSTVETDNEPMLKLKKKLGFSWGRQTFKIIDKMIEPTGDFKPE